MNLPKRLWDVQRSDIPEDILPKLKIFVDRWKNADGYMEKSLLLVNKEDMAMAETAMAILLKFFQRHRYTSFCISVLNLRTWVESTSEIDDRSAIEHLSSVRCLGLYDVGADTKFCNHYLDQILRKRYDNLKPTIFASHLDMDELEKVMSNMMSYIVRKGICIKFD